MNLVELATSKGLFLCAAESLTAGAVASSIASTPGASRVFLGSVVAYSDASKSQLLSIPANLISDQTAVSETVAIQMSQNCAQLFAAANAIAADRVVSVATTGVAGPDPVGQNPVGLVFIAIASRRGSLAWEFRFDGNREAVSRAATSAALQLLREELEQI